MHVVLGRTLDGGAFPTVLDGCNASAGSLHLGPAGFLARLEQSLGIPTPLTHEPVRVAEYAKRLAIQDDGQQFYSASRRADPWRVARKLLTLRDELISAGWNGKLPASASLRLKAFADLERISGEYPLAPGAAKRLLNVIERLRLVRAGIESLELVDPTSSFPKLWRDVFQCLANTGTEVRQRTFSNARSSGDLSIAQKALLGKNPGKVNGDGSLLKIEAKTLTEAAEATAASLASLLKTRNPQSVVLIRDGDPRASLVLETALRRHDLASAGLTLESSHRPATQILPLFLGLAWKPVDPDLLLQFLTLPSSPIPTTARQSLRQALSGAPGFASQAWQQARAEVLIAIGKKYDGEAATEVDTRLKLWLDDVERTPRGDEMPIARAIQLTRQVEDWANRHAHAAETDPFFIQAKEQASVMCRLLELHPRGSITSPEMGRLLYDVMQTGISYEMTCKQQESTNLISSPAAIFAQVPVVIWWQCVGSSATVPAKRFWTDNEVQALEQAGCDLLSPTELLLENARTWRRPVLCATESLILVQPEQVFGEVQESHPIWNEITMKVAPTEAEQLAITADTASLLSGRHFSLVSAQKTRKYLPKGKPSWKIPPPYLTPRSIESPTALEALLGCPLKWTLQYKARVRESLPFMPERELLYGTLAHQIVGAYLTNFIGQELPQPAVAREAVIRLFDEQVEAEAAILIKPGMDRERTYVRQTIGKAAAVLVELLDRGGYRIDSIEEEHAGSFLLGQLQGRTDLIVRRFKDGKKAVIDLKWSGDKRKIQALREGTALQLAAYAYFLRTKDVWPSTAYFLFPNAQLYSSSSKDFPGSVFVPGPSEKDTWDNAITSMQKIRASLDEGEIAVPCFVEPDKQIANVGMNIEPPCKWCSYQMFCRYA
ncbi:MAG TPA: PD-(D/E)XK nuclease family protein [Candidatus Binatia bacterium]|nr:PD-(D/E)XK nuclease family protein [Candidatus Binatia bacterium]